MRHAHLSSRVHLNRRARSSEEEAPGQANSPGCHDPGVTQSPVGAGVGALTCLAKGAASQAANESSRGEGGSARESWEDVAGEVFDDLFALVGRGGEQGDGGGARFEETPDFGLTFGGISGDDEVFEPFGG
jgi:hypothetical protein